MSLNANVDIFKQISKQFLAASNENGFFEFVAKFNLI
jgi:hypothetical protein